jgi:23S rRNA (uracil1939-C5)-methyltransferase
VLPLVCDVAELCGGCPQIRRSVGEQRAAKQQRVAQLLAREGLSVDALPWLYHDAPLGYRNRIRLRVTDGVPAFFNPNKVAQCAVLQPELRVALAEFRAWANHHRKVLRGVAHAEIRAPDERGIAAYVLQPALNAGPEVSTSLGLAPAELAQFLRQQGPGRSFEGWVVGEGQPPLQRCALGAGVYAWVPVGSFLQVNTAVNRLLVAQVRGLAVELGCRSFCDLFCGSGNLSLPLLHAGLSGWGLEQDPYAIQALRLAAQEQGFDACAFAAADVHAQFAERAAAAGPVDLLVVDPPRAGLKDSVPNVLTLKPEHVVLCCCNAESFVRDLTAFRRHGYRLRRLWLCDMFAHTAHVELLAWLSH